MKLLIKSRHGGEEEVVDAEFSESDWEALQNFVKYAARLEKNPLAREGVPFSLTMNFTPEKELDVNAKLPSEEQIDALLVKMRPFILKSSPTYFQTIRSIVGRVVHSRGIRRHLDTLDFIFKGLSQQQAYVAGVYSSNMEPQILNSEAMLEVWLNGERFHQDKGKEKILAAIQEFIWPEMSMAMLLAVLGEKVRAVLALRQLVDLLAGRIRELSLGSIGIARPSHYRALLCASVDSVDVRPLKDDLPPSELLLTGTFDCTPAGSLNFCHLLNYLGKLWLQGGMPRELGMHFYRVVLAPGFSIFDKFYEERSEAIVPVKIVALLEEDDISLLRRNPGKATLRKLRAEKEGKETTRQPRTLDKQEELDEILGQQPAPKIDFYFTPGIACGYAYWPIGEESAERALRIFETGRLPSFEEVEVARVAVKVPSPESSSNADEG